MTDLQDFKSESKKEGTSYMLISTTEVIITAIEKFYVIKEGILTQKEQKYFSLAFDKLLLSMSTYFRMLSYDRCIIGDTHTYRIKFVLDILQSLAILSGKIDYNKMTLSPISTVNIRTKTKIPYVSKSITDPHDACVCILDRISLSIIPITDMVHINKYARKCILRFLHKYYIIISKKKFTYEKKIKWFDMNINEIITYLELFGITKFAISMYDDSNSIESVKEIASIIERDETMDVFMKKYKTHLLPSSPLSTTSESSIAYSNIFSSESKKYDLRKESGTNIQAVSSISMPYLSRYRIETGLDKSMNELLYLWTHPIDTIPKVLHAIRLENVSGCIKWKLCISTLDIGKILYYSSSRVGMQNGYICHIGGNYFVITPDKKIYHSNDHENVMLFLSVYFDI